MERPARLGKLTDEQIAFWRNHYLLMAKQQLEDLISTLRAAADFADGEIDHRNITVSLPDMQELLEWLQKEYGK